MKGSNDRMIQALCEELSDFSRRSFHRGLVSGAGGNMSLRIPGTETVLITPTGVSLADIEPGINLLMSIDGTIIKAPSGHRPSKETGFHLSVYRLRPDVGAIAHLHPPYATAFSNRGKPLPLVTVNSRGILQEVPCVECAPPGSKELCDFVTEGIVKYPGAKVLLMREHGLLATGPDLRTAYYLADLAEATAQIAYISSKIA
jgi:L-ribulose-5-phosphate 4-epimerase